METRFVKAFIDELTFSNLTSEDRELLKKHGYTEDEQGEVAVSFKFGDGIAYVPNGCGLVLHYPTLVEVAQSEKMQREIAAYTCRPDIIPFDIALKYGRLGEYKYVLNYDEWVEQGENCNKDICSLYRKGEDNDLNHYLDCFEQEYDALYDNGYFPIGEGEGEDGHTLRDGLTDEEIYQLQAEYGILWTECIGTHQYNEQGFLEKVA